MSLNLRPAPRPRRRDSDLYSSSSSSSDDTIVSSQNDRFGRQLAQDDVHLRAPIVLAPTQINPLVQADKLDSELTSKTWRLATTGKDRLVDGRRYENALWRLWAQQRLGIRRIDAADFDWNQLLEWNHRALLGPVVISHETAHSKAELLLAYSVDATPLDYLPPAGPAVSIASSTASEGSPLTSDAYGSSYGTSSTQQYNAPPIRSHEPDRTLNQKFISDGGADEEPPTWNVRSVLSYIRNASPARNLFSSSNTAGGYFSAPTATNSHGPVSSSSSSTGPGTPPAAHSYNSNVIMLEDGTLLRPCITRRVSSSSERSWSTTKSSVSPASERRQYVGGAQGRMVKFNNCVTRGAYAVDGSREQRHALGEDDDEEEGQSEEQYSPPLVEEAIDEEESEQDEEDETPVETPALGVLTALNNALVHLPPLPIPHWLRVPGISTPPLHVSNISTPPVVSTPPAHGGNIEVLPPTHLCPVAEVDERGHTVVFVPPEGMEQLCEDDLVPLPPKTSDDEDGGGGSGRGRTLTRSNRSRSSLDLTLHPDEDERVDEMEVKLAELGAVSASRRTPAADATNEGDGDEGDAPEMDPQFEPGEGVASRRSRRRKQKSSFILREEDEE